MKKKWFVVVRFLDEDRIENLGFYDKTLIQCRLHDLIRENFRGLRNVTVEVEELMPDKGRG